MSTLLLIPTRMERAGLSRTGGRAVLCGMGPVDAAAGAMRALMATSGVSQCVLAGIAGTYDPEVLPIGSVVCGGTFQLHGVGAGVDECLILPEQMGLPADAAGDLPVVSRELATARLPDYMQRACMLTVCAASVDAGHAQRRHNRYTDVLVEEMEAFAVARACRLAGVPFNCVRAISNIAGDRDAGRWRVQDALLAIDLALSQLVES